jgi:hypothetical protein
LAFQFRQQNLSQICVLKFFNRQIWAPKKSFSSRLRKRCPHVLVKLTSSVLGKHQGYLNKCQISIILNFEDDKSTSDPVAKVHPLAVRVNLHFGSILDYKLISVFDL